MREKLITSGVRNLRTFGYPAVTAENILTDEIYSAFFSGMLKDAKGASEEVDTAVDSLLAEIEGKTK
jgi:hypothetical protein